MVVKKIEPVNFVLYNTTSSLNTLISTIIGYKDEYFLYLSNVRNSALAQVRSDVYFKLYTLKDVIYQGCLDDYGCLKKYAMKQLREYCGFIE